MKKLICALLTLAMVFSLSVSAFAATSEKDFSDFPTGWSHDAMKAAVDNSLLQGSNGKIDPSGVLTRAQMAAVLVRAMGGTAKGDLSSFTDVSSSAWYYNELSVAVGMKLIKGSGTLMRPNAPISREETAAVLARALCLKDGASNLSAYPDAAKVATWAKGSMSALVDAGYMKGDGRNLNPKASITREEFAQLMFNMISTYYPVSGTYTESLTGNVVLKADGTMLDGITVSGDVIVGDGVGNGTVTIKNCNIGGRIVARGGGENSVIIINSAAGQLVAARPDGALHIDATKMETKADLIIADGKDKVIVGGAYNDVSVEAPVPVVLTDGSAQSASVAGNGATLTVDASASVGSAKITSNDSIVIVKGAINDVAISNQAQNSSVVIEDKGSAKSVVIDGDKSTVTVQTGATVNSVVVAGTGNNVVGSGSVASVTVSEDAKETVVATPKTEITNNSTDAVTTNDGALPSGDKGTTNDQGGLNEGGSTGGGTTPTKYYTLELTITNGTTTVSNKTSETAILSGSTPFYYQAATLINAKKGELETAYNDPSANAIMNAGLAAYPSDSTWKSFVGSNFNSFSFSAHRNLFELYDVTFEQLAGTHTITYGAYTVTVSIT